MTKEPLFDKQRTIEYPAQPSPFSCFRVNSGTRRRFLCCRAGLLHRGPLDVNSEAATGKGSDMCVCGWDRGRESTKRSASFNRSFGESGA